MMRFIICHDIDYLILFYLYLYINNINLITNLVVIFLTVKYLCYNIFTWFKLGTFSFFMFYIFEIFKTLSHELGNGGH